MATDPWAVGVEAELRSKLVQTLTAAMYDAEKYRMFKLVSEIRDRVFPLAHEEVADAARSLAEATHD